ncbi:MAG: phytoene/squalene synthase family protein [Hyphomicrobiaceae bacterium]
MTIVRTRDAPTADLAAFSRDQIAKGSKSFALAARLFSPDIRASAYMLYAWCRHCDDIVDGQVLGFRSHYASLDSAALADVIANLERKTRMACRDQADEPAFQALAQVCRQHAIPQRHPLELIAGFRMDAENRKYETLEDTLEYAYHVAGVVGVMMAMVMGVRERAILHRASDLGIAFQLTNIARDVIQDHEAGRVYLPSDWLAEAGLSHATMAMRENREALFAVTDRLLQSAEPYYDSAQLGLSHLPWRSAWAVATARSVYRSIGVEVRRRRDTAWDSRTATGLATKLSGVFDGLICATSNRSVLANGNESRPDGLWTMPDQPLPSKRRVWPDTTD